MILYNALTYANQPPIDGTAPIIIGGQEALMRGGDFSIVDPVKVGNVARQAKSLAAPFVIDIEQKPGQPRGAYIAQVLYAAKLAHQAAPGVKVGIYNMPTHDWYRTMALADAELHGTAASVELAAAALQIWKGMNAVERKAIAPSVEITCPSLYSFGSSEQWQEHAGIMIDFAWTYGNDILAFICPQTMRPQDGAMLPDFLDGDDFGKELWALHERGVNVVLWAWNPGRMWDETWPWVGALRRFIRAISIQQS